MKLAISFGEAKAGTLSWELKDQNGALLQQSDPNNPIPSGSDLSITVANAANPAVNSSWTLRIWSSLTGSLPDSDVGKISISGSYATGSGGELRVLIAGPADSWPDDPIRSELTATGVRDMGLATTGHNGIYIVDDVSNPGLSAHTRLAAYTSGDIRGEVDLGQVQRIQCGFDPLNTHPGDDLREHHHAGA